MSVFSPLCSFPIGSCFHHDVRLACASSMYSSVRYMLDIIRACGNAFASSWRCICTTAGRKSKALERYDSQSSLIFFVVACLPYYAGLRTVRPHIIIIIMNA